MTVAALEERARAAGLVDERQSISDLKPFKAAKRRSATRIAVLVNPTGPDAEALTQEAQSALRTMGRPIELLTAGTSGEIEMAFATLVQQRAEALLVTNSNLFANRAVQLVTLAAHHRVPTIYYGQFFARAGGLASYGPGWNQNREASIYVGRILKGEQPSGLPVKQPTKFDLVINLQTAKTLGLTIPETLLATADEVIQ